MKQRLSPKQVSVGSKLAEEVYDESTGAVLLANGCELSEHLIELLCRKKIKEVAIVVELTPAERRAAQAKVKACLERRFQLSSGHPLMDRLKQMIFDYRCREQQ